LALALRWFGFAPKSFACGTVDFASEPAKTLRFSNPPSHATDRSALACRIQRTSPDAVAGARGSRDGCSPKPAPKPAAAAGKPRRTFITWFSVAWIAFTATNVGFLLGCIRFLFPNVLSEPPSKFKVGDPSQFEEAR